VQLAGQLLLDVIEAFEVVVVAAVEEEDELLLLFGDFDDESAVLAADAGLLFAGKLKPFFFFHQLEHQNFSKHPQFKQGHHFLYA
jgi:hypothetical protein